MSLRPSLTSLSFLALRVGDGGATSVAFVPGNLSEGILGRALGDPGDFGRGEGERVGEEVMLPAGGLVDDTLAGEVLSSTMLIVPLCSRALVLTCCLLIGGAPSFVSLAVNLRPGIMIGERAGCIV